MAAASNAAVRQALLGTGSNQPKDKGPPVADGILSVTPDTPEVVEWRSRSTLDPAETSSTYLDDDDDGPKPHSLYGRYTWKIENFSEISKRELRSNVFDVGSYKWYILVYPQGCDVCNHLSLFLCVADYDKLLPGWSHFAQFTIAVVNKDPKKSKYSDTLHRFCKKEHDWGWKKYMELSKVLDGFTVADTLVIKAQVQVILDKPSKPFRCLDPQYRRELVRVYLTNVEGVCRRFCDDKRARLMWAKEEAFKFKDFWGSLSSEQQRKLLTEKGEAILKGVVKQFFNEKEVTSTLVMDALYSGCKQIEEHSRQFLEGKATEGAPLVLIKLDRNVMQLHGDILDTVDKVTKEFIPAAKDDNKPNDGLALRSGQEDDYRRDTIERDEKRLAELGRKTVEMFVISHLFTEKLEIAYREAEALRRQDLLIEEETQLQLLEDIKRKEQAEKDKEKKAKKKERVKQKKEAEKAKKDAEEAERKRQEDVKRAEHERKAKEAAAAEKKRLEEAALAMQQQNAVRAAQVRAEKAAATARAAEQQRQATPSPSQTEPKAVAQAQQQQPARKHSAPAVASSHASQPQPQQAPKQADVSRSVPVATSSHSPAAPRHTEDVSSHTASSASSSKGQPEPDSDGSQDVGTVKQAQGQPDSESLSEDDDERVAELEAEVATLRQRVRTLELSLAERDAEVGSLRGQVSKLAAREAAAEAAAKDAQQQVAQLQAAQAAAAAAAANASASGSRHSSTSSIERDVLNELIAQANNQAAAAESKGSDGPGSSGSAPTGTAAVAGSRRGESTAAHTHAGGRGQANGPHRGSAAPSAAASAQEPIPLIRASSAAPAGQSYPVGPSATAAAAAAAAAAQANGRPRASSDAPSATSNMSSKATQSNSTPYQLAQAASAAAVAHANSSSLPDSLPSYRNAAAGVMGAPGGSLVGGVLPPVSPSATHKLQDDAPAAPAAAAAPASTARTHLNPVAPEFSGQRLMMPAGTGSQQAQAGRGGMTFGQHVATGKTGTVSTGQQGGANTPAPPAHRMQQAPQDSPGLDDFAHMGLIDDLLGAE